MHAWAAKVKSHAVVAQRSGTHGIKLVIEREQADRRRWEARSSEYNPPTLEQCMHNIDQIAPWHSLRRYDEERATVQNQPKRSQPSTRNSITKGSGANNSSNRKYNTRHPTRVESPENPLTSYRVFGCRTKRCRQTNCWYGHTRRETAAAQTAARLAWSQAEIENGPTWHNKGKHHIKVREWYLDDKEKSKATKSEKSAGA